MAPAGTERLRFTPGASLWLPVGIFLVLLIAVYWRTISVTAGLLTGSEDMAHGVFAPVLVGFVAWEKRRFLLAPCSGIAAACGLLILTSAALVSVVAVLGGSTTLSRFGLLLSLFGAVTLIGGFTALKEFTFPISLLLFTFPLPSVLYGEITLPLQLLASALSESALELLGYSVYREGNIIELGKHRLSVVEACSGIRSLITLGFFCLAYSYLLERKRLIRTLVVLAAVPAAILMNVARITITGMLVKYDATYTTGVYHDALAWVCLVLGFAIVYLFHKALQYVYIRGHGAA